MSERALKHRRTHNLLLIQKLLNLRDAASPFTLIIDTLEQSAKPLLWEYIKRSKSVQTRIIFVSFESPRRPAGIDVFIRARRKSPIDLHKKLIKEVSTSPRSLIIVDTLHPLASLAALDLPSWLSSLVSPQTSLVAVYHQDILLQRTESSPYVPDPLTLLQFLATTILCVHSLAQMIARRHAADKSLAEPVFGLREEIEGILKGMHGNDRRGVVLEMEHRRKSGRGISEWFFIHTDSAEEKIVLLQDNALYRQQPGDKDIRDEEEKLDATFDLGLTEKQRRDREGVVLPYFDAQKDGGGVGGRILYDMGVEDDFDEEEDEI
ncbi:hypothetical protein MMC08_002901 [Hypocenomyce scalaris]|nr:hypothetical protein [Hypocenomyce scalaris]